MRTALDDPSETLNDYERQLIAHVREHGWRSTHVFDPSGETPSFTYTTGFWATLGKPEVIVFDFPRSLAYDVLGQMSRELKRGRHLATAEPLTGILANESVYLFPVRQEAACEYLLSSRWFYKGADFPCLQLVWADQSARFQWEEGFNQRLSALQPDLSESGWTNELAR